MIAPKAAMLARQTMEVDRGAAEGAPRTRLAHSFFLCKMLGAAEAVRLDASPRWDRERRIHPSGL